MVFNALQRPIEKTHQTIWDVSHDYGRIEWQLTLSIHKKLQRLSTKMSLKKFIRLLGGGGQNRFVHHKHYARYMFDFSVTHTSEIVISGW